MSNANDAEQLSKQCWLGTKKNLIICPLARAYDAYPPIGTLPGKDFPGEEVRRYQRMIRITLDASSLFIWAYRAGLGRMHSTARLCSQTGKGQAGPWEQAHLLGQQLKAVDSLVG